MLVVAPSGESMLVDAGWGGFNNAEYVVTQPNDRDADRIAEIVKLAKVKQIDYFVVTHYDTDHVGGVPRAVAKLHVPVLHFIDHGEPQTKDKINLGEYQAYLATIAKTKAQHTSVKTWRPYSDKGSGHSSADVGSKRHRQLAGSRRPQPVVRRPAAGQA